MCLIRHQKPDPMVWCGWKPWPLTFCRRSISCCLALRTAKACSCSNSSCCLLSAASRICWEREKKEQEVRGNSAKDEHRQNESNHQSLLRDSSPRKENSVIIYLPSGWLTFLSGAQKEILRRMSKLPFPMQSKRMGSRDSRKTIDFHCKRARTCCYNYFLWYTHTATQYGFGAALDDNTIWVK